jgi:hypothetical protein
MKLAVMQPYFFPYLGYYQAISAVDKYILYDDLNYIKEGFVNKNRYLVVNGKPSFFVVPVKQKSSYKKIREIEIIDGQKWKRVILNSIFMNYKLSPYFNDVIPVIENVLNTETNFLTTLNARSIMEVSRYLDIRTQIKTDIGEYHDLEEKLESTDEEVGRLFPHIKLDYPEKKVIRVFEICKRENAEVFVNAIGGQSLYNKVDFARHNIALYFVKTDDFSYPQRSPVFYPNLSIIDVMMNCGKEKTKELLYKYTLI